jgi:multiple sugar transport system substrate-binding protein
VLIQEVPVRLKQGLVAAVAGTGLLLGGCSSGEATSSGSADPAKATGEIRVLVANFPVNKEGNSAFKSIVDIFHKTYPKIKVKSDFVPYDGLNQKISTSLASGQNYDVISAGIGWVQPLADLGAIQNLTDLGISKADLSAAVYPAFVPPMLYKGDVYAVPVVANPRLLAYSKSAFKKAGLDPTKPPQSLAELRDFAKKLTIKDGSGEITQTGFDFFGTPANYRQQFVAFMGALGGVEFQGETPKFDSPAGVQALKTMHDMMTVDKSSVFGFQNAAKTSLVTTGAAAMGFTGPYVDCSNNKDLGGIGDKCKDLVYFNLKDTKEIEYVGGRVAALGEGTKFPDAGLAFLDAFRDSTSQIAISKFDVGVPVDKDAGDSEFVKSNPAGSFASENLSKGVFEYGGATFLDFRAKFGPALDAAILGKESPSETLANLKKIAEGS